MGCVEDVFFRTKTILGCLEIIFFFFDGLLPPGMTGFAWGLEWAKSAMVAVSDPGIVIVFLTDNKFDEVCARPVPVVDCFSLNNCTNWWAFIIILSKS